MANSVAGIGGLVFFLVLAGLIVTLVTGATLHWIFLVPGIFMGLYAAGSVK